jgi:hypothetical protein
MINSKIYLNVPYAQKDAVKALGARWDAINKKWYVSSDLDMSLFKQWQSEATIDEASLTLKAKSSSLKTAKTSSTAANQDKPGVITYPTDKDFVAYNGAQPPWL